MYNLDSLYKNIQNQVSAVGRIRQFGTVEAVENTTKSNFQYG